MSRLQCVTFLLQEPPKLLDHRFSQNLEGEVLGPHIPNSWAGPRRHLRPHLEDYPGQAHRTGTQPANWPLVWAQHLQRSPPPKGGCSFPGLWQL